MGKNISIKVPTAVVQTQAVIGRKKIQPKKNISKKNNLPPKPAKQ